MEKHIATLDALETEAQEFVDLLIPGEQALLVTLSGELGAGKTAFTQAVARALGITDSLTSPTFVLEKIYELPDDAQFRRLVHIDAYRLQSGADLKALGFHELLEDPETLILLEWPEKVADGLPEYRRGITITPNADGSRTFIYG